MFCLDSCVQDGPCFLRFSLNLGHDLKNFRKTAAEQRTAAARGDIYKYVAFLELGGNGEIFNATNLERPGGRGRVAALVGAPGSICLTRG